MRVRSCPPHYRLRTVPTSRKALVPTIHLALSFHLSLHPLLALIFSPLLRPDVLVQSSFHPRSLSFREHPSRALALLECYRVAQCLTCTLPSLSPTVSVMFWKSWKKEAEKVPLIPRAFFRALEKVGSLFLCACAVFRSGADLIILTFSKKMHALIFSALLNFFARSERAVISYTSTKIWLGILDILLFWFLFKLLNNRKWRNKTLLKCAQFIKKIM